MSQVYHLSEAERQSKIGYKVIIESECIDSYHSQEEFGEWNASYQNTFKSIRRKNDDEEYPDLVSDLDIPAGEEVFVVWLEYSSGDSFGWGQNTGVEVVGLFQDYAAAVELRDRIEPTRHGEFPFDGARIKYQAKDGQDINIYYGTWTGYFENLETIHIEKAVMG